MTSHPHSTMDHRDATIGVDMGTTAMKAVAFDGMGYELARAQEPVALHHDATGAAEADANEVADAATRCSWPDARSIQNITSRASGLEWRDAQSAASRGGRHATDARSYLDGYPRRCRSGHALEHAARPGTLHPHRHAHPRDGSILFPKLLWLRNTRPGVFDKATRFISLKEWVWRRWLGAEEVDASIASATGLFNLRDGGWDREALGLASIEPEQLSPVVPTMTVRHGIREPALLDAGIGDATAFVIGASDGVLANLGVGILGGEETVLTIGTSCAVRTGVSRPVTDVATRSFCYVLAENRYIAGGASNSGGIVLDWLAHHLLSHATSEATGVSPVDQQALASLLAAAADAADDDLLLLPYISGERAPLWDAAASGACVGLRLRHTSAHVLRAAVEGVLFNAYWIASGLFNAVGRPQRIIASGKVLEAGWIRQLAADIFGLPVVYRGDIDASVRGAALLAEIATGVRTWDAAIAQAAQDGEQVLGPAAGVPYAHKFARFQSLARLVEASACATRGYDEHYGLEGRK